MNKENTTSKPKMKLWIKIVIITLSALILIGALTGGYFLYKYLFPTDKELLVMAHKNTINDSKKQEEPETFANTTDIYFEADGEFTTQKSVDMITSIAFSTKTTKLSDEKSKYDLTVRFMGNDFITSHSVKDGDTEVLTVPQLIDQSFGADSWEDVLSMLLGSEQSDDTELFKSVDKKKLKKYFEDYFKDIYNRIPDKDITSVKEGTVKTVILKTDMNRALYETLTKVKNDKDFRDFLYIQLEGATGDFNRKYPYAGTLIVMPEKEKFDADYEKSIDDFIKKTENSQIVLVAQISNDRRIISETVTVESKGEVQYFISYSKDGFKYVEYDGENVAFAYEKQIIQNETQTSEKTIISFDINDMTKEKVEGQKNIHLIIDSKTDTNVTDTVELPKEYTDIRTMTDAEKQAIIPVVNKNFTALLTTLTLEIFSYIK
ncbi:MAG: hypothetical protein J6R66_03105 [Clostridia bacterium]|nr:hypothetical protein [Clostridia bacterium]